MCLHHHGRLPRLLSGDGLGALLELGLGLESHDSTSPGLDRVRIVIKLGAAEFREALESSIVGLVDRGDGNAGGVLLVNEGSEAGLVLHDAVGDIHLFAKGGHPDDELNGLDIAGNHDHLGLLLLDESGDVVKSKLDHGSGSGGSGILSSNL